MFEQVSSSTNIDTTVEITTRRISQLPIRLEAIYQQESTECKVTNWSEGHR